MDSIKFGCVGLFKVRCVVLGHVRLGCLGFFKDRLLWDLLSYVMLGWVCSFCVVLGCLR